MKIKFKKIKGFTLSEMIVVLLITTIVVGMAFSVLNLVQRHMQSIEHIYDAKTEVNKLRQALWVDFNRFNSINFNASSEELIFSNALESKYYKMSDDLLVRDIDTFNIKAKTIKFYFDNYEQSSGEIDAIEIQTSKENGGQNIFVYKNNTPEIYINR